MNKPVLMTVPVRCDCTCRCGDDPWLKDGRSRECLRRFSDRQEAEATALRWRREAEARELAVQLGHADVLEAMRALQRVQRQKETGNRPA